MFFQVKMNEVFFEAKNEKTWDKRFGRRWVIQNVGFFWYTNPKK